MRVKMILTFFLYGKVSAHHCTELITWRHEIEQNELQKLGVMANSSVLETWVKAFVNRKDGTIGHIFLRPDLPIILVLKQDLLGQELDSKQWVRKIKMNVFW